MADAREPRAPPRPATAARPRLRILAPPPAGAYGYGGQPMPGAPAYAQYAQPQGPIGHMRPTGMTMLLFFVTLGIWGFIYYYQTHEEMKRHSGRGRRRRDRGGDRIFVGIVNPFLLSHEVGQLYSRRGRAAAGHRPHRRCGSSPACSSS